MIAELTKECEKLKSKSRVSEINEAKFSSILAVSTAEYTGLQNEFEKLHLYATHVEEELLRTKLDIETFEQSLSKTFNLDSISFRSKLNLNDQVSQDYSKISAASSRISTVLSSKSCFQKKSLYEYNRQWIGDEQNHPIMKKYLHVTAIAVKLHFPDNKISTAELIEIVKNAPFYLFHDIMMQFMQGQESERMASIQDVKETESVLNKSGKPRSWLSRLFNCKQGTPLKDEDSFL